MLIHPWDTTVRFTCRAEIIDDPAAKAELLTRQLAHFQPEGDRAEVPPDGPPYGRMLSGIRGLVLHVVEAAAKFKYDDHRAVAQREEIAGRLAGQRTRRRRGQLAEAEDQGHGPLGKKGLMLSL